MKTNLKLFPTHPPTNHISYRCSILILPNSLSNRSLADFPKSPNEGGVFVAISEAANQERGGGEEFVSDLQASLKAC